MTFKRMLQINWLVSLYFNFHYLPFRQAIKLPVVLFKPALLKCKGEVIIENEYIRTGMIQLGERLVSLYPKGGITWENNGGRVIFKNDCIIGSSSSISIGEKGVFEIGDNFRATAGLKLTSHYRIRFDRNVLIAWEVIVMDTSFHRLKDMTGNYKNKGYGEISIGKNNWITTRSMILSGTKTPDYCIVGAGSILSKDYSGLGTHILLAGNPVEVKSTNVWIDLEDYDIEEYS